jgi:AcrR family transcriptional regulator
MAVSEEAAMPNPPTRGRGRPRLDIDLDAVSDTAARIFSQHGYDAVSIESVAAELGVSRATLYRTVPTKDALLSILFERSTADLLATASEMADAGHSPGEALRGLIRVHVAAAVRMGPYMTVFTNPAGMGAEALARWRRWTHDYEKLWASTVERAMAAGVLPEGDVTTTTRLLLGMLIWVSRWHGATRGVDGDAIAETAIALVCRRARAPRAQSKQ